MLNGTILGLLYVLSIFGGIFVIGCILYGCYYLYTTINNNNNHLILEEV